MDVNTDVDRDRDRDQDLGQEDMGAGDGGSPFSPTPHTKGSPLTSEPGSARQGVTGRGSELPWTTEEVQQQTVASIKQALVSAGFEDDMHALSSRVAAGKKAPKKADWVALYSSLVV